MITSRVKRIALLAGALMAFTAAAARAEPPKVLRIDAEVPADFPKKGFSHDVFEELLHKHVTDGFVDYPAWRNSAADMAALESYLYAVGLYSPDNAPERFSTENDAKAYWIYVYNAFVIKAVLDRWPLDSVLDVKANVQFKEGQGFFWRLRFIAGGRKYPLLTIEKKKVFKQFGDPRPHFMLNCASISCPALRPDLPVGEALEPELDAATVEFVSETRNVAIDHAARTISLSQIFEWYEKDFTRELERRGVASDNGIVDYLIDVAPPELRAELERAVNYHVKYIEYDWGVNLVRDADTKAASPES